jgi:uncharacterized membrane protein
MRITTLRSAIYLAAGIGLVVSLFAAAEFFDTSLRAICSPNSFFSCSYVDQSGKTTTLGIPDYLWGVGGFVLLLGFASVAEKRPRDVRAADALALLATVGVALSLYFLYVELAEIHAVCPVCATAYLFGGIVWVGSIALARKTRTGDLSGEDEAPEEPGANTA